MSEPIRVAVVVEGPTDAIVLEAILSALLPAREIVLNVLQPEGSIAFDSGAFGRMGGGWTGVYRWCRQAAHEGNGSVANSAALFSHDVLVLHVDADVASSTYANGNIADPPREDLPCEEPCPPPERTTNALRAVIVHWLGEQECPPGVVLCTPSKSTEAWVVAAVWPDNEYVLKENWECHVNPAAQLATLPIGRRFKKNKIDYRRIESQIADSWHGVAERFSEAARFGREFLATIAC